MPKNIKVSFKNPPRGQDSTYSMTILNMDSTGIVLDNDSVNPINTTQVSSSLVPCSGSIYVLDYNPTYTLIKSGLTYGNLITGSIVPQVKCSTTDLFLESEGECSLVEKTDLVGMNGSPRVVLTVENDGGTTITGVLNLNLEYGFVEPYPTSSLTISRTGVGISSGSIYLGRGTYSFEMTITGSGALTTGQTATITYMNCDDDVI